MVVDLDRFKAESRFRRASAVRDSILLTLAAARPAVETAGYRSRRLSGDQYAMLLLPSASLSASPPRDTIEKPYARRSPSTTGKKKLCSRLDRAGACRQSAAAARRRVLKDAELADVPQPKRIAATAIEVFKPAMRARKSDRLTLETDLRRALERQENHASVQPMSGSRTARLRVRALMRWDHPKMGRLSHVGKFIALAEETGPDRGARLVPLDQTTRQLGDLQRATRKPLSGVSPASTYRRVNC